MLHVIFRRPLAMLLAALTAISLLASGAAQDAPDPWMYEESAIDNTTFLAQAHSAVDSSAVGSRSIFSWSLNLFSSGALPELVKALSAYEINRVYQTIPELYFARPELAAMVRNLSRHGIQTAALNGSRDWVEKGLDEYKRWIDRLSQYNKRNPACAIEAVALDVESYTYSSFREDPAAGFAAYAACMEQAYRYAHDRGLRVIQVIPTSLDGIDRELFEKFVEDCCDEISLMNYRKDTALGAIWNEVLTCRRLGKPVETIYETMPLSERYDVTEAITYFYEGRDALAEAVGEMQSIYGASLGIGYHHLQTLYHVESGLYLAELYPYAAKKSQADTRGQLRAGDSIRLKGDDGSTVRAWLYNPNLDAKAPEYCYLAVGVSPEVSYTITPDNSRYEVTSPESLRFQHEDGKLVYTASFHVKRR